MMTRSSYLALMLLCISTNAIMSKDVLGCGAGGAVLGYSLSYTDLCKPSDGKPKELLCEAGTAAFFGGIIGLCVGEVWSRSRFVQLQCDLVRAEEPRPLEFTHVNRELIIRDQQEGDGIEIGKRKRYSREGGWHETLTTQLD